MKLCAMRSKWSGEHTGQVSPAKQGCTVLSYRDVQVPVHAWQLQRHHWVFNGARLLLPVQRVWEGWIHIYGRGGVQSLYPHALHGVSMSQPDWEQLPRRQTCLCCCSSSREFGQPSFLISRLANAWMIPMCSGTVLMGTVEIPRISSVQK